MNKRAAVILRFAQGGAAAEANKPCDLSGEFSTMEIVEPVSDPQKLSRCIRDLVALSTLPAIWRSYTPHRIADSVAAVLVPMLDAEFVFVSLSERLDGRRIEAARAWDYTSPELAATLGAALQGWITDRTATIPNPIGKGTLWLAMATIGQGDGAFIVAASRHSDFPSDAQKLLLVMGANETALGVFRWHAERDERRFAVLVENSSDFIGISGLNGDPVYVNPAGLRLVGLDGLVEARRVRVLDYIVQEEKSRFAKEIWAITIRKGRWTGELNFRHFKTGATIPFFADIFRIDDPYTGEPMNVATVSRDLTAQKEAEVHFRHLNESLEQHVSIRTAELADSNRRLMREIEERERADRRSQDLQLELFHAARLSTAGQMAGALAHELNQPLTAAANFVNAAKSSLAKDSPVNLEMAWEDLDDALKQILRAGQIIRRLREFERRGETGKQIESVTSMVEEATALAVAGSDALGVEVEFCFDPSASTVVADRIQIQQVLVNLIRNALEAMKDNERRRIAVTTALVDAETVEVSIVDHGPGIPQSLRNNLFDPLVSTKRHGMGLGLSISHSIVESHGGRIRCEQNPDGGTIFRFTLAAAPADEIPSAE